MTALWQKKQAGRSSAYNLISNNFLQTQYFFYIWFSDILIISNVQKLAFSQS